MVSLPVRAGQFEGPLDLLLALVRQHQVDLEQLPIGLITGQYLGYLEEAGRANIELGADFIYMAATLIQLKSASLLPRDPTLGAAGGAPDERRQLIDRLQEHARAVEAAALLEDRLALEEASWSNPPAEFAGTREIGVPETAVATPRRASLADLLGALEVAMTRSATHSRVAIDADPYTVGERIAWLRERMETEGLPLDARPLLEQQPTASASACLFLGMLELARLGEFRLQQAEPFAALTLI